MFVWVNHPLHGGACPLVCYLWTLLTEDCHLYHVKCTNAMHHPIPYKTDNLVSIRIQVQSKAKWGTVPAIFCTNAAMSQASSTKPLTMMTLHKLSAHAQPPAPTTKYHGKNINLLPPAALYPCKAHGATPTTNVYCQSHCKCCDQPLVCRVSEAYTRRFVASWVLDEAIPTPRSGHFIQNWPCRYSSRQSHWKPCNRSLDCRVFEPVTRRSVVFCCCCIKQLQGQGAVGGPKNARNWPAQSRKTINKSAQSMRSQEWIASWPGEPQNCNQAAQECTAEQDTGVQCLLNETYSFDFLTVAL
jgi:hypothetical protein